MFSLSIVFLIPAAVLVVVSLLWVLRRKLPKTLAVLPVWTPYAMCGLLLVLGGLLHRVAHVKLLGMEVDLAHGNTEGESMLVLGGPLNGQRPARGLEITGLPPEALGIKAEKTGLRIVPGPGYERGILVRSGGRLIPLEPGGVPRLTGLRNGDKINIPADEGGEVIAEWRIGSGVMELAVSPTPRWLGADGQGVAKLPNLPAKIASVKTDSGRLVIVKGEDLSCDLALCLNGRRLDFTDGLEVRAVFMPGVSRLSLVKTDPLAGVAILGEQSPLRRSAWVDWTSAAAASADPNAAGFSTILAAGQRYTAGGGHKDSLYIKGLPHGALELHLSPDGKLRLALSKSGEDAVADGEMEPQPPLECSAGGEVLIGKAFSPSGGRLKVTGPASRPEPAATAEENPEMATRDPGRESGIDDDAAAAAAAEDSHWRILFIPNDATRMPLENRVITLPLMEHPLEIYSRRPWEQRLFSLSRLSARESTLRSAFVYGVPHPDFTVNGVSLLQFEPGLHIERNGKQLPQPEAETGVIDNGAPLEILRVVASDTGREFGNVMAQPLQPGAVYEGRRVTVLQRFASVTLDTENPDDRNPRATLRIALQQPQTRSVPMSDIRKNLEERDMKGLEGVKFGINERHGLSDLPHQLTFPKLTTWFDQANADVEMNFSNFTIQDDYSRRIMDYGDEFTIGGTRRLVLTLTKETVPLSRVIWVGIAGLIALVSAWRRAASYWWIALMSGAAFLTCARVLFGQAALVNAPYNKEVIQTAMAAVVAVPLFLGIGGWLIRGLLPGRIEGWLQRVERRGYVTISVLALVLLVVRVALLLAGAKESVNLGFRFALSLFFVPLWLVLTAQAAFTMWREKEAAGGFTARVALRFLAASLWLFGCQSVSALLTSDLGMFLYFIPGTLLLAALGLCTAATGLLSALRLSPAERKSSHAWIGIPAGMGMLLPLLGMLLVFLAPQWTLNRWPGLMKELASNEHIVTDTTMLRVLQFADEDYLINVGTDTAERIAQDHAIMDSYAHRGLLGEGYLQVEVLSAKSVTALNDNVSAVYIFAQFGVVGGVAVTLAYLGMLAAGLGARGPRNSLTAWLAVLSGMSLAAVSIYMMLANRGHLPFTGRNMSFLGLNSWSDVAESLVLTGFIILGLCRPEIPQPAVITPETAPDTGSPSASHKLSTSSPS